MSTNLNSVHINTYNQMLNLSNANTNVKPITQDTFFNMVNANMAAQTAQVFHTPKTALAPQIASQNPSIGTFIGELYQKMQKQENASLDYLVNKSSLTELAMTANEASIYLRKAVKLRDQLVQSINNIWNMNI